MIAMPPFESVRTSERDQKRARSTTAGPDSEPTAFDGLFSEGGVATFLKQADKGRGEAIPEGMVAKGKSFRNQVLITMAKSLESLVRRASDLVRPRDQFRPDGRHEQLDQNHEATNRWLSGDEIFRIKNFCHSSMSIML